MPIIVSRGWRMRSLPAVRRTRLIEVLWKVHGWVYQRTGGRLGGRLLRMPVLLLTTTGRRTGLPHTSALTYLPYGPNFVVIGSNGGAAKHPAWLLNLRANPRVAVQVQNALIDVYAREARGEERKMLWDRLVQVEHSYAVYQSRTTRTIPIMVLERR